MTHQIKINRALQQSTIGTCPGTASTMLAAIPVEVIAALPARLIAQMLDANWQLAGASKATADVEAIGAGFVWDAAHGIARDILPAGASA